MGNVRRLDLDRGRAERLLQRGAADGGALRDILAAASSQANPAELTGEDAAVAAFRAARVFRDDRMIRDGGTARTHGNARGPASTHNASAGRGPGVVRGRGAHRRVNSTADAARTQPRSAAKVVVVMTVLGVSIGGVGIAASTGAVQLSLPLHHAAPAGNNGAAKALTSASGRSQAIPFPAASASATTSPPRSSRGMCEAYVAAEAAGRPLTENDPVFVRLSGDAGGAPNVAGYCDAVLNGSPHPSVGPPPSKTHPSKPHPPKPHPSKSHEPNPASSAASAASQNSTQSESPDAAQPHATTSHTSERNVSAPGQLTAPGLAKSRPAEIHPTNK